MFTGPKTDIFTPSKWIDFGTVYIWVFSAIAGPSDAPLAPTPFEAFVKVPKFLRPHTQIYCTRYCCLLCSMDPLSNLLLKIDMCGS